MVDYEKYERVSAQCNIEKVKGMTNHEIYQLSPESIGLPADTRNENRSFIPIHDGEGNRIGILEQVFVFDPEDDDEVNGLVQLTFDHYFDRQA